MLIFLSDIYKGVRPMASAPQAPNIFSSARRARVAAEAAHAWWHAQKARANYGEFVQALLRIGVSVALLSAYYPWVDWGPHTWVLNFVLGFIILSLALFGGIYRARGHSDVVRFFTLAVDMGAPTILLGLTGERSAILVF